VLRVIRERMRQGTPTTGYPEVPESAPPLFRGMPTVDPERCRGHARCAPACPTEAISVDLQGDGGWTWRLDRGRCLGCGACAEACPQDAIAISPEYELAVRRREDLVVTYHFTPAGRPLERPAVVPAEAADGQASRLRARIGQLFRSSLQIRHLDAGSSNAEDWELNALLNSVYDLQRLGIDFVASPRHADMLVVTGAVARNLHPALLATYEATPEPRLVVAIGTDACSGGLVRDSYATAGGVDQCLPVDVYVPGDPPRPQAILHGLLLALDRRAQKISREERIVPAAGQRADRVGRPRGEVSLPTSAGGA
jgi:Ni,Fe-hydrogenase III small subunit/formate hydrogenlyase subunit 6/NADH:ubiquinone oxidoreductase subunit I